MNVHANPGYSMKLTFLGATDTVTGSRYLVETANTRILVDCGLFQGVKRVRERNWAPFPVDPDSIDAVVLTHAHIDHSGYVPAIVRNGFRGKVHVTGGTASLLNILWPDSGHLQEEEAKFRNRHRSTKHSPALPLYTEREGINALSRLARHPFEEAFQVGDITVSFHRTGHILGAGSVLLEADGRRLAISGDVGRPEDPVMLPPDPLPAADVVLVESTYGNRLHGDIDVSGELGEVVRRTMDRQGVLLIPAFAVGRAQTLLHLLAQLQAKGEIPKVPVYLNSPMAIAATDILLEHASDHRLTPQEVRDLCETATYTRTVEESKSLNKKKGPMIIISAAGMITGGRILHHLVSFIGSGKNTVLITGFQSPGTRGSALVGGADEIKIYGKYHRVVADVERLEGLSAHADRDELLEWLKGTEKPERAYVIHGEPESQDAFRLALKDQLGWNATVPELGETIQI